MAAHLSEIRGFGATPADESAKVSYAAGGMIALAIGAPLLLKGHVLLAAGGSLLGFILGKTLIKPAHADTLQPSGQATTQQPVQNPIPPPAQSNGSGSTAQDLVNAAKTGAALAQKAGQVVDLGIKAAGVISAGAGAVASAGGAAASAVSAAAAAAAPALAVIGPIAAFATIVYFGMQANIPPEPQRRAAIQSMMSRVYQENLRELALGYDVPQLGPMPPMTNADDQAAVAVCQQYIVSGFKWLAQFVNQADLSQSDKANLIALIRGVPPPLPKIVTKVTSGGNETGPRHEF